MEECNGEYPLGTEDLTHSVIRGCIPLIGNDKSEILTMKKELLAGTTDSRCEMSLLLATGQSTMRGASESQEVLFRGTYGNKKSDHIEWYLLLS